jgi:hypothetical protein
MSVLLVALSGCGGSGPTKGPAPARMAGSGEAHPSVTLSGSALGMTRSAAREVAMQCGRGSPFAQRMAVIGQHGLSTEVAQEGGGVERSLLRRAVQDFLSQLSIYGAHATLTIGQHRVTMGTLRKKLYGELAATTAAEPCDAPAAARLGGGEETPHRASL